MSDEPTVVEEAAALELTEWDPRTMPDDCCCLMIGARHSGKSVLLTDIMFHKRNRLDMVMGMNPTEEANHTLATFTPPGLIYDEYNDQAIRDLMEWQKRCLANDSRNEGVVGYKTKTCKVGLILDDCMGETDDKGKKKSVMKSGDIDRVFKLGRHFRLFFICAMQYIKDAPPTIRGNVDYVFVFDTNSMSEKDKLWREYFSMFTFPEFMKVFSACVGEKYNCIVLDVRRSRGEPGKGIYFYKATNRIIKKTREEVQRTGAHSFQVGRRVFWDLAKYYFADRADIDLDPTKLRPGVFVPRAPAPAVGKKEKKDLVVTRKKAATKTGVDKSDRDKPAAGCGRPDSKRGDSKRDDSKRDDSKRYDGKRSDGKRNDRKHEDDRRGDRKRDERGHKGK